MKSLIAKILIPNGAVFGVVIMTNIELVLKVGLLLASLVYTILHCALAWKKLNRPEK